MTLCDTETGGNILCIRLSALGDVVHCMNALTLLRQSRPSAHITWIVEGRIAGILENHPYIDELVTIPRIDWGQALKDPWRWTEVWPEIAELMSDLRKTKFDISIDFQSSLKSAWLVAAAGAAVRIGFSPPVSREFSHLIQNRPVTVPTRHSHRIERNIALLAALGIPTRYAPALLPCARRHREVAEEIGRGMKRPLVIIHPGASAFAEFKRWLPERYGELARRLIDEAGASVLVTFGPGEEALAHRVVGASMHRAVLAPRLAHLQQLTGLLDTADLFIGGDTGPMHIASALKTPVVALFGPKDPAGTGPFGVRSQLVSANVPCSPCTRRECPNPVCMERITVDQAYCAATRLLFGEDKNDSPTEINTAARPFYCFFELGHWRGKMHTAFSRPDFYRSLSMIGVEEDEGIRHTPEPEMKDGPGEYFSNTITFNIDGRDIVMHLLGRHEAGSGRIWRFRGRRNAGLRHYLKTALRFHEKNIHCMIPVCWMQRFDFPASGEILILDTRADRLAGCFNPSPPPAHAVLPRIAAALRRFHSNGFHHFALTTCDLSTADGAEPFVISLEKVRFLPLPPLIAEICWGCELRTIYRELRKHYSPAEINRSLLQPYCSGHIDGERRRRLLARTIHPELDPPRSEQNFYNE